MLFRILWAIDIVVALVAIGFFVWGLGDGSVSSFNIALWVGIFAALAIVVIGSRALNLKGQRVLATLLAALPAIPAVGYAVLVVAMLVSGARWN